MNERGRDASVIPSRCLITHEIIRNNVEQYGTIWNKPVALRTRIASRRSGISRTGDFGMRLWRQLCFGMLVTDPVHDVVVVTRSHVRVVDRLVTGDRGEIIVVGVDVGGRGCVRCNGRQSR